MQQSGDLVRAHRKELAEGCARAEELAYTRAAAAHAAAHSAEHAGELATLKARLGDAEQSLASARASHQREVTSWRLQVAGLRETAAAEQRLTIHAMDMHGRARAEIEQVRRLLEAAEREAIKRQLTRDAALEDLDQRLARSRDTLDDSGVRFICAADNEHEEEDAESLADCVATDRMRASFTGR